MRKAALGCTFLSAISSSAAMGNEKVDLGEIEITEQASIYSNIERASPAYESFDPIDTGLSVMSGQAVENRRSGGIDTTELLRPLPFVQMDASLDDATKENIQSLRPKDFSISGGNYYDNNISIDGISATSIHDVTAASGENDWNNVYTQTSQTLYLDPTLIGNVEVFDSNISARHGDFIGGVVNYEIRDPKDSFAFNITTGFQNDSLVKYHAPAPDEDEQLDPPADFTKYQTSVTVDFPVTDRLFLLAGYSRAESKVQYEKDADLGSLTHDNGDVSQNFLLKGRYEYSDDLTFEAQIAHSPYESERDLPNTHNGLTTSESSGTQGYFAASGFFEATSWESKLSLMHNNSSRRANNTRIAWRGEAVDWCYTTRNCIEGGVGNLDQTQTDYTWKTDFSTYLQNGTLNYGSELSYTDAEKSRDEEARYYYLSRAAGSDGFDCAPGDPACNGLSAASRDLVYQPFDANVSVYNHSLWGEYLTTFGNVDIRAGARYSYDDFLGNHNLAPRLTGTWQFMPESFLTLGANRYYGKNMVGYAINEQVPVHTCYERQLRNAANNPYGGMPGQWDSCAFQPSITNYSTSDLNTPYSDELTASLTFQTPLNGHLRPKVVYRENRDQFSRSEKLTDGNGQDYYTMSNDGETDYLGYALEWSGNYKSHFFNANVAWSETQTNGAVDYTYEADDKNELVYYNERVMTMAELREHDARQNFAAPLKASLNWSTDWFNGNLITDASLNYRGKYEYLTDSRRNHTDSDGNTYDIYEETNIASLTTVDTNLKYHFLNQNTHNASIDFRIKNIFDRVTGNTSNYQIGRSFWLGLNYAFN